MLRGKKNPVLETFFSELIHSNMIIIKIQTSYLLIFILVSFANFFFVVSKRFAANL